MIETALGVRSLVRQYLLLTFKILDFELQAIEFWMLYPLS